MTQVVDPIRDTVPRETARQPSTPPPPLRPRSADTALTDAVRRVLESSAEPLTPAKIRAHLPGALRRLSIASLSEALTRQVEAGVLHAFCPYRSQQQRYWHRPMPDHIACLIRSVLQAGPLTWSQMLRKLPEYAHARSEDALRRLLAQRAVHRHPGVPRGGDRYGLTPPDPREPLRQELTRLFERLCQRGFTEPQLRAAALELLREEEWGPSPETPCVPSYQE